MLSAQRRWRCSKGATCLLFFPASLKNFTRLTRKQQKMLQLDKLTRRPTCLLAFFEDLCSRKMFNEMPASNLRSQLLTFHYLMFVYYLLMLHIWRRLKYHISPSILQIPVYSHLRIHPTVAINLPQTIPKCLETSDLPNLQYIFLEPEEPKTEWKGTVEKPFGESDFNCGSFSVRSFVCFHFTVCE